MPQRRVTLRDVAAAAGVSAGTASYALNGSPLVRPATRDRVLAAAHRLNYVSDRNAARLRHGRSECIAVGYAKPSPEIADETFYALVVRGITEVLEEHGYTMRLVHLDQEVTLGAGRGLRRPLNGRDIDGLLVLNWQDPVMMDRLRGLGVPLVAVDSSGAHPGVPSVDNDDRGGTAAGVSYLIRLGHRRIGFLSNALDAPFGRETFAGYLQACEHHGLAVEPGLLRTTNATITGGRTATAQLLESARPPTAVFAVNDESAAGAMQAIHEAGLRIPHDVSVVGMDDLPLAAAVRPSLTTVRIETEALGRRAAEMLLQTIAGTDPDPRRVVLPTRLVVRDSAGPAPPSV